MCYPPLDVYECADGLCVEMESPGVNPDDVNVEVMGRSLVVTGMKKDAHAARGVRYIRMGLVSSSPGSLTYPSSSTWPGSSQVRRRHPQGQDRQGRR